MRRTTVGTESERRGEIDGDALVSAEIPIVKRGYAPGTVDDLLERAAATIDRLQALDEPELERRRRSQADLLHRTLMLAQAGADHQLAEAESTAASVIADAQARASRLVAEAEEAAKELVEAQAARTRSELNELLQRRARVHHDLDALERYATQVRARLREVFTSQAQALEHVLDDVIKDRPALCEIDLTDPMLDTRLAEDGASPAGETQALAWTHRGADDRPVMALLVGEAETRSA